MAESDHIDPLPLGIWLFERPGIWQLKLQDQSGLDSFSSERGLPSLSIGDHVEALWTLGFLRADLIESPIPLVKIGLLPLGEEDSTHFYADQRTLQPRPGGWLDAVHSFSDLPKGVRLLFHPFRYYVLWHIQRILQIPIARLQPLYSSKAYRRHLDSGLNSFAEFSAAAQFAQAVNSWNDIAELAIAAEPCFYQQMFGRLSHPSHIAYETQLGLIDQHWQDVQPWFLQAGVDTTEEYRRGICVSAEALDPNKDVHTLLRLSMGDGRIHDVKGRLGGSMLLLTMAELLRRAAEKAFETFLPEEDELGFGLIARSVKRDNFGTERLLDAPAAVKTEWIRSIGLGAGVRLRWYVEGDTEYHALDSIVGRYIAIQLVNLRGQVAERRAKGVSFRESLRGDTKSLLFSFISIDGDREDFVRVARKAAVDDDFCGMFFISQPDFEFQNFTIGELEEILWSILVESHHLPAGDRVRLHNGIHVAKRSSELFASLSDAFTWVTAEHKGAEWGKRLMQYALVHPDFPDLDGSKPRRRQIVDALENALRCVSLEFNPSRKTLRVDPSTGRPVARESHSGDP